MSKQNKTKPSLDPKSTYTCMTGGTLALDVSSELALEEYDQAISEGKSIIIMDSNDAIVFDNESKS